ncbi:hypothetical protein ACQ4PT_014836 [Festuca glaucescens]
MDPAQAPKVGRPAPGTRPPGRRQPARSRQLARPVPEPARPQRPARPVPGLRSTRPPQPQGQHRTHHGRHSHFFQHTGDQRSAAGVNRWATDGGANLDLVVQEDAGAREHEAASMAMSSGASWCSTGQLARDWTSADLVSGEVISRASTAHGDQTALVPGAEATVPATTHKLFNDYRSHVVAASQEALGKLYHVEKSIALPPVAGYEPWPARASHFLLWGVPAYRLGVAPRAALFQKTVRAYQKGKAQYHALKQQLQRVKGTALHFHRFAIPLS